MNIQSTARKLDPKKDKVLSGLAMRKDVDVVVETDLITEKGILDKKTIMLEDGCQGLAFSTKDSKSSDFKLQNGMITATSGMLSFSDLGLQTYAESVHESVEAPLDVLVTIVSTGKAISTFQQHGAASWKTAIDTTQAGASAFAALSHAFPQLQPYAAGAKLLRLVLQSGQGLHEVALALKDD